MSELFDDISRIVGSPIPRRRALKAVGGALIGAFFATSVYRKASSAQTASYCCRGPGGSCFSQDEPLFCDRLPWTQEKCEESGYEWRPGHSCCPDGHTCPTTTAVCCGATCCDSDSLCLDNECCPTNRVCQNSTLCCPSGTVCVNDVCCPTNRVCTDPVTNQTICCSSGRCCGGTKCCPSGVCTSDGMNCSSGGGGGNPIAISPAR